MALATVPKYWKLKTNNNQKSFNDSVSDDVSLKTYMLLLFFYVQRFFFHLKVGFAFSPFLNNINFRVEIEPLYISLRNVDHHLANPCICELRFKR